MRVVREQLDPPWVSHGTAAHPLQSHIPKIAMSQLEGNSDDKIGDEQMNYGDVTLATAKLVCLCLADSPAEWDICAIWMALGDLGDLIHSGF